MNERLKRRKKTGSGAAKDAGNAPAPEPLQPRFYDDEPAAPVVVPAIAPNVAPVSVPVEPPAAESHRPSRREPELDSQPVSTPVAASEPAEPKLRPSRRRRSRGGRGGARPRTAAAVAESPAAEASATEVSGELSATEASTAPSAAPEPTIAEMSRPASVAVQAVPVQSSAAPVRPSKGTVVLAIGLPGSGKSSWFKRHNIHPLSSDLLRELLFDDAQEQRFQDLVFSNLRSMLKARLIARRPMNYVDATNLTPHDRHSWIKLAKDYGYDVQGVFFDVPLEICVERHQRRGRAVPEDVMRKMAGKLKPPTFEEGFSKITVVRVKQKEATAG